MYTNKTNKDEYDEDPHIWTLRRLPVDLNKLAKELLKDNMSNNIVNKRQRIESMQDEKSNTPS